MSWGPAWLLHMCIYVSAHVCEYSCACGVQRTTLGDIFQASYTLVCCLFFVLLLLFWIFLLCLRQDLTMLP